MAKVEFQTLPLEIRQIVYDFVLGNVNLVEYSVTFRFRKRLKRQKTSKCRKDRLGIFSVSAHGDRPTLLAINHKIRKELFNLIFARATFRLACHHPDVVLPDRVRDDIELVHCGLIDLCCQKDIYSFSSLRRLTCQVYFDDRVLRDYGFLPGCGPDTKEELKSMVIYGLNPAHEDHWTFVNAGYPFVMNIFQDENRTFKMRIMATASWAIGPPEYFDFTEATVDVDSEMSG